MTIADTGIDLDFITGTDDIEGGDVAATPVPAKRPESTQEDAVANEIADILIGTEAEPETQTDGDKKSDDGKVTTEKPQVHLDPALIHEAATWGIHPDEARTYPNNQALRAVVQDRERRYGPTQTRREVADKAAEIVEERSLELPVFDMKLDEDADPAMVKMAESMTTYAASLKEHAETELKAMREEMGTMRDESKATTERMTRATHTKIVQAFDDEVASWDDPFKEMLGVPSQSTMGDGSDAQKLNEYVTKMQYGHAAIHGSPDPEEAVRLTTEFVRQGRHALWPEMAQKEARRDVSKKLRNQKGSVGLRPNRARNQEPPEQGDNAAKAAIGDFFAENNLDPWGRKPSA
ncbi:hypothetical protein LCGC14_0831060 [marine sediment metagenome]|uniref:Uncharacterized protein n=1 Tax=marine sediment metagenome TaxID=412755 RepID=A0A0F9PKK5_9ZZZZ